MNLRIDPYLKEVSFSIKGGQSLAIVGRSGSGKTTLLRAIAGFADQISAGSITWDEAVWQDKARRYVSASERCAALQFQESAIWPHLTVRQQLNLVIPATVMPAKAGIHKAASKMDASLRWHDKLALNPNTLGKDLSGGERQRLALGRILRAKPGILLLDEPFASLDQQSKAQMIRILADHQRVHSCAILIATHDQKETHALGAPILELL